MGTWTAFYVEAEVAQTVAACGDWLRAKSRKNIIETCGEFPDKARFHLTGKAPRRLIVSAASPTWTEVHVDGFYDKNPAAIAVSQALKTRVVDTIAQTTSDSYSLTVYASGECVRQLTFNECEFFAEGAPLKGEPIPLTTQEEGITWFAHEEMGAYCRQVFGFEHWMDMKGRVWVDLAQERGGLFSWLMR